MRVVLTALSQNIPATQEMTVVITLTRHFLNVVSYLPLSSARPTCGKYLLVSKKIHLKIIIGETLCTIDSKIELHK